ncbi:MAG: hypothetical protein JNM12_05095 [Alphaproteobacteria bacterium]|nr:hypothetical protein [Alphaproteobacteria bacterium]
MDLGLPPIDPEKAFNAFENIRKAFQEAASADTGAAQPLFQSLSDKFNKMVDDVMELGATDPNISPSKIMFKMMPVIMDVQKTASQLQRLAQTDERVADTMATLAGTIKNELTSLLPAGGLGGLNLPGLGGLGGGNSTPASEDKPNINPKKPKKPGNGGSFDL